MTPALNIISNNLQGYGASETSSLPCLGVSGRAVSISPGSKFRSFQLKVMPSKCSLKFVSVVCKASSGGQRRNPDFSRQNRHGYSRNRNRFNGEKDSSENLDESEFLSTKNGPILSLSNSPKSHATASPGPREREIVELFRKVQAQLRERAAVKEEKKIETAKGQNKESETVDSLLKLLRKHSSEQGKNKVNGGNSSDYSFDRSRQNGQSDEPKSRSFFTSDSIVGDEPHEFPKPSPGRPVSSFRRRSPVPRVKYEPVVSAEDTYGSTSQSDLVLKKTEPYYEPVAESDDESDLESDKAEIDIASGLELEEEHEEEVEQEEEEEEDAPELELEPKAEFVGGAAANGLPEVEVLDTEEDDHDDKEVEKQHTELKDLNSMKLVELRALAKARGMKGFSKLKKSELVGLLSDDFL